LDPATIAQSKADLRSLAHSCLDEKAFWGLFIQCIRCKNIMPKHLESTVGHQCFTLESLHRRVAERRRRRAQTSGGPTSARRRNARPVNVEWVDGHEVIVISE
jgi:hypothetical protein